MPKDILMTFLAACWVIISIVIDYKQVVESKVCTRLKVARLCMCHLLYALCAAKMLKEISFANRNL